MAKKNLISSCVCDISGKHIAVLKTGKEIMPVVVYTFVPECI